MDTSTCTAFKSPPAIHKSYEGHQGHRDQSTSRSGSKKQDNPCRKQRRHHNTLVARPSELNPNRSSNPLELPDVQHNHKAEDCLSPPLSHGAESVSTHGAHASYVPSDLDRFRQQTLRTSILPHCRSHCHRRSHLSQADDDAHSLACESVCPDPSGKVKGKQRSHDAHHRRRPQSHQYDQEQVAIARQHMDGEGPPPMRELDAALRKAYREEMRMEKKESEGIWGGAWFDGEF